MPRIVTGAGGGKGYKNKYVILFFFFFLDALGGVNSSHLGRQCKE